MVLTVGMGTSAAYQRALLLLQQNRPADAERELRHVLVFDPQHAMAHMMLARCLVEQERLDEAQQHAMEGVRLAPDEPMSHYTMSLVLFSRNRFPEAEAAIRQAIGADSLAFLSIEGMLEAIGRPFASPTDWQRGHCLACFTGEYPTEIPGDLAAD